ncbi:MAG: transposase [Deltaproteobacteria bacterium]|nr:transposase [Deltaproteobacteria bacterium]
MSKRKVKHFTIEQKRDAVRYYRESGLNCPEVARNIGVAPGAHYKNE